MTAEAEGDGAEDAQGNIGRATEETSEEMLEEVLEEVLEEMLKETLVEEAFRVVKASARPCV